MVFRRKEISFWLGFLLLNTLLYLPKFLINSETSHFIPWPETSLSPGDWLKWMFRRDNQDIFRISFDWLILTTGLLFLIRKPTKPVITTGVYFFYLLLFLYQLYQGSIYAIYQQAPLLYSDIYLIKEGLSIIYASGVIWIILIVIILGLTVAGIYWLVKEFLKIIEEVRLGKTSLVLLGCLSVIAIIAVLDYKTRLDDQNLVVPVQTYWMYDNINRSIRVKKAITDFNPDVLNKAYDYGAYELKTRPNVFIVFIESYGKVLYDDPKFRNEYLDLLKIREQQLRMNEWFSTTALSLPPVKGGRSWLSFTSFLTGSRVDNHATYDFMVNRAKFDIPNLMKSLKDYGYGSYWLSVIKHDRTDIPIDNYDQYYGIDDRLLFEDLNYKGKLYGPAFPAPPDQYSLSFANEYIRRKENGPFVLFFITLNSHHPFDPPEFVVEDWKKLSTINGNDKENETAESDLKNQYIKSIKYEFDYLTEFIIQEGDENDIFIIIGDHQPPLLANNRPDVETPAHIISKNRSFLKSFEQFGFNPGLRANEKKAPIWHEGIYSMFMNALIREYGDSVKVLPPVFEKGISTDNSIQ